MSLVKGRRFSWQKIYQRDELLLINVWTLATILVLLIPVLGFLRIPLGLPVALFFPGYALMAAVFPGREALGVMERVILSAGLSLFMVPLMGLLLHFTPLGVTPYTVLFSLAIVILALSLIAWVRRERQPGGSSSPFPSPRLRLSRLKSWDGALSLVLAASALGALTSLVFALATQPLGEKRSEFYLLGMMRTADLYPSQARVGESRKVTVGVVNREGRETTYLVQVRAEAETLGEAGPVTLAPEEKWEREVGFIPRQAGKAQKVEFLLFKQQETQPDVNLILWLDINNPGEGYSELYLVDFPRRLLKNQDATLTFALENQEQGQTAYHRLELWLIYNRADVSPQKAGDISRLVTAPGEVLVREILFRPSDWATETSLQLRLFKEAETQPFKQVSYVVSISAE